MSTEQQTQTASDKVAKQLISVQLEYRLEDLQMIRILSDQLQDWIKNTLIENDEETQVRSYLKKLGLTAVPVENTEEYLP